MRILSFLIIVFVLVSGCHKSPGCTNAVVTLSARGVCKQIGVILDGVKYPTDNLPTQYAIDGLHICIDYSFWDDPAMGPCDGGRKVHVIAVH